MIVKRFFMLMALALMLGAAMALSGVAQAKPISGSSEAKCAKLAMQTLGPSVNPSGYTFILGTAGDDNFSDPVKATTGSDVFCGYGGDDFIATLDEGDIFLGGDGRDYVNANYGTFDGGAGDDSFYENSGTFEQ
jgi:hypothetical protein